MKMYVRLIAMLLALVTMLGVAVSCANTNGGDETTAGATTNAPSDSDAATTEEETLYVPDDLHLG